MHRTEGPREILPLTGLRALLAWWVVALHFVRELLAPGVVRSFLEAGHLAVDMFFVLSGYVLTKRYAGADLRDSTERKWFWLRRVARLYPLYALSLAMGVLASPSALAALQTKLGVWRLALQILALNAWTHVAMFHHNWAAWSLSVEMFFYLCFPLLLPPICACSRGALQWLFASMCGLTWLAPALYTLLDPDHLQRPFRFGDEALWVWYVKFFPVQRLPEFVAGMLAARWVDTQRLIVSPRVRCVAAPVLGLALVGSLSCSALRLDDCEDKGTVLGFSDQRSKNPRTSLRSHSGRPFQLTPDFGRSEASWLREDSRHIPSPRPRAPDHRTCTPRSAPPRS